jgi:hypothetical protein
MRLILERQLIGRRPDNRAEPATGQAEKYPRLIFSESCRTFPVAV